MSFKFDEKNTVDIMFASVISDLLWIGHTNEWKTKKTIKKMCVSKLKYLEKTLGKKYVKSALEHWGIFIEE